LARSRASSTCISLVGQRWWAIVGESWNDAARLLSPVTNTAPATGLTATEMPSPGQRLTHPREPLAAPRPRARCSSRSICPGRFKRSISHSWPWPGSSHLSTPGPDARSNSQRPLASTRGCGSGAARL